MKKLLLGAAVMSTIFFFSISSVDARTCGGKSINPEGTCATTGTFKDPSLDYVVSNQCDDYKTYENDFCTTYCREEATTFFPTTIPTVNLNQTVHAGGYFVWNPIQINGTKECQTKFEYGTWELTYRDMLENMKVAYFKWQQEYHQRTSDKKIGNCTTESSTKKYVGKVSTESKTICDKWYDTSWAGSENYGKCEKSHIEKASSCSEKYDDKMVDSYTIGEINNVKIFMKDKMLSVDLGNGENECYVETITTKAGEKRSYTPVHYNPDNSISYGASKSYCTADSARPYNADVDKFWDVFVNGGTVPTYQDGAGTTLSSAGGFRQEYIRMINELKKCNGLLTSDYDFNPKVIAHYKDPVGYYTDDITLQKSSSGNKIVKREVIPDPIASRGIELPSSECKCLYGAKDCEDSNMVCDTFFDTQYSKYMNSSITTVITNQNIYSLPTNYNRYTLKPTGKSVSNLPEKNKNDGTYIDLSKFSGLDNQGVYPVHYSTPTGKYPISLSYTKLGDGGSFDRVSPKTYMCYYKVTNKIACPDGECPDKDPGNPDVPGNPDIIDPWKGLNVVYRPISLSNPFPGKSGTGRTAGENWTKDASYINTYIKNNRGVSADNVYDKDPLYSFTLTPSVIKDIKNYNSGHEYTDFNMICYDKGKGRKCKSNFLRDYSTKLSSTGTCSNASANNFYSCANKAEPTR